MENEVTVQTYLSDKGIYFEATRNDVLLLDGRVVNGSAEVVLVHDPAGEDIGHEVCREAERQCRDGEVR